MKSRVRCFLLEPTGTVRVWLRRYERGSSGRCTGSSSYHTAMTLLGDFPAKFDEETETFAAGRKYLASREDLGPAHDDPRWPTRCECGQAFADADPYQVFQRQLYVRADTGETHTAEDAPPGAMWDAWWMGADFRGPDGRCWTLKLPGGSDWCIDGPASDGGKWTRSGAAPDLTATPSILTPRYHGWLRGGWLEEC